MMCMGMGMGMYDVGGVGVGSVKHVYLRSCDISYTYAHTYIPTYIYTYIHAYIIYK
jgi:hypothetical protein